MREETFLLLFHILEAVAAPPCWQGATFPEAVVSLAVDSSGITRVPGVVSLADCVAACCDLPGCDLAWFFKGRCYTLSCQQGASCRPQVRPGADSVLAFLQKTSPQTLLQSLVRGEPHGSRRGPGGDLEPGPGPVFSDPRTPSLKYSERDQEDRSRVGSERFNQSESEGGSEGEPTPSCVTRINLTSEEPAGQGQEDGTRTPTGSAAEGKTTGTQKGAGSGSGSASLTPGTDSTRGDHVTSGGDIIFSTARPLMPSLGDPVDAAPVTPVTTHTSEPFRYQTLPAHLVLQDVTSDPTRTSSAVYLPNTNTPTSAAAGVWGSNRGPIAVVGPDRKLFLPLSSLLLDGSGSSDDHGVVGYRWEVVSGPPGLKLEDADQAVAVVTGIQAGHYTFRLTVSDQEGETDSTSLTVRVQEARTFPPVAHASGSHVLTLPNNSLVLRGSVTDGDQTQVRYLWTRDSQSPAAGLALFGSETHASLYLSDLVEGTYLFQLRVTDAQGRSSSSAATVEVRPEPGGGEQVELEMLVSVSQVSVSQRDTVVRQLAALIHVPDRDVQVRSLRGRTHLSTVLRFSVRGPAGPVSASQLVVLLKKQLLREKSDFLLFKVLRVESVVCQLSCSGRGQCDPIMKQCACDPFWTENLIRRYLGDGESNCEWRVLFVILSSFLVMVLLLSLSWTFICCSRRGRRTKGRKRTRYTILDDMDEQERLELRPRFSIKHRSTEHNSSLMMSESELDSDQDPVFSRPVHNRNWISTQAACNRNSFG